MSGFPRRSAFVVAPAEGSYHAVKSRWDTGRP